METMHELLKTAHAAIKIARRMMLDQGDTQLKSYAMHLKNAEQNCEQIGRILENDEHKYRKAVEGGS